MIGTAPATTGEWILFFSAVGGGLIGCPLILWAIIRKVRNSSPFTIEIRTTKTGLDP